MQIVSFLSTQGRRMRYAALPFICGAVIAGLAVPTLTIAQSGKNDAVYRQLGLFGDIFQRVRESYVDEVDDKDLVEAAINGMLTSLDPHSSFLNNDHFSDMQVQTKGKFGGLGIEITMEEGVIKIVSPIDDTPAAEAGLQPEDLIIAVNDEPIRGMTLNDAVDRLRGEVGSSVTVTIKRGAKDPFDVSLKRDTIKIRSVRAKMFDGIGYLRITTFSEQTTPGLTKEVEKMFREHGKDLKGFVLDLRNNPGGLLSQAIRVSDAFLEKGEIVSTRGRDPQDGDRYNASPDDLAEGKPIVVLINGGSASASEIVAGALQDHRRAVVVGTRSFGKGSVQTVMPLGGDGAMRLTTARYYTPSGRSIQALGVSPDIIVEQPRRKENEEAKDEDGTSQRRSEADLRGSLLNDSLSDEEIKQIETDQAEAELAAKLRNDDFQLSYAIDLLKGMMALAGQD